MSNAITVEVVQDLIERDVAAGTTPRDAGIAVAVVRDGEVVLQHGFGLRDRARRMPVTVDTSFAIGSLTKAFTSAALVSTGVDLDRPLNRGAEMLPVSDPDVARELSLADVLSHRSGVSANDLLWYFGAVHGVDALLELVRRLPVVPGVFRQSFLYNNLLYGAVGGLFERLAGATRESIVRDTLLSPLGMHSTSLAQEGAGEDVALPYVGVEQVPRADTSLVAAAGGMASSVRDMTRWMIGWLAASAGRPSPIAQAVVTRAHTRHIAFANAQPDLIHGLEWLGDDIDYGLGWFLARVGRRRVVFHTGIIDGYSAVLALTPEEQLGVVALCNVNGSALPGAIARAVLSPGDSPEPLDADSLAGEYTDDLYGSLRLVRSVGGLWVHYQAARWPVRWTSATSAEVAIVAAGQGVPVPMTLSIVDGRSELVLPLGLDPRIPPARFRRR